MKSLKKNFLVILIIFVSLFSMVACAPENMKLEFDNYIFYSNENYGDNSRNYLDICIPKNKSGSVGLILMLHGGGWIAGDKDCYTNSLKQYCDENGYVTAAINYRYADGDRVTYHEILDDITLALIKIKQIASDNNILVDNMLITGGSAGAHLSLLYAYSMVEFAPIKPVAVVSFCGPTDFTDENFYNNGDDITKMVSKITGVNMLKETISSAKPFLKEASPISYVSSTTVPTIICHGEKDTVVPYTNATLLSDKLTTYGIEHELISFPNSNHGLESDTECMEYSYQRMFEYCERFL